MPPKKTTVLGDSL
jgi:hypothetical protein